MSGRVDGSSRLGAVVDFDPPTRPLRPVSVVRGGSFEEALRRAAEGDRVPSDACSEGEACAGLDGYTEDTESAWEEAPQQSETQPVAAGDRMPGGARWEAMPEGVASDPEASGLTEEETAEPTSEGDGEPGVGIGQLAPSLPEGAARGEEVSAERGLARQAGTTGRIPAGAEGEEGAPPMASSDGASSRGAGHDDAVSAEHSGESWPEPFAARPAGSEEDEGAAPAPLRAPTSVTEAGRSVSGAAPSVPMPAAAATGANSTVQGSGGEAGAAASPLLAAAQLAGELIAGRFEASTGRGGPREGLSLADLRHPGLGAVGLRLRSTDQGVEVTAVVRSVAAMLALKEGEQELRRRLARRGQALSALRVEIDAAGERRERPAGKGASER